VQANLDGVVGFEGLLEGLNHALAWLQRLDVRTEGTRYQQYQAALRELVENYRRQDWRPDADRTISALYEAADLQTIHSAFDGQHLPGLVERLRSLVNGPEQIQRERREDGGIHARNIGFELIAAGRMVRGGLQIELNQRGDVVTTLDDQRVVVECKRPRRPDTVRRCLERARQQALGDIDGRGANGNSALIAIDASVVINPGNALLMAKLPLAEALDELAGLMGHATIRNMEGLWHGRILGTVARFSALVVSDGIPVYAQQWVFVRNEGVDARRLELAEALSAGLRAPAALRGAMPGHRP
jgi:hypothetical protein